MFKFINSFTSFGKPAVYFEKHHISEDLIALEDFYRTNGFFQTEFRDSSYIDSVNNYAFLYYFINEGSPSSFGIINLNGLEKIEGGLLWTISQNFNIDSTKRYSQDLLVNEINKIVNYLANSGYMLAAFDSTIIYRDTAANKADIEIYFSPNNRYQIGDISVVKDGIGSENVEEELIIKIVGYKSGEEYELERIQRSQVRLYRTGLFTNVLVAPQVSDTVGNIVPLLVSGSIGSMNELSPEILMRNENNAFQIGLGGSYMRKNFLGGARKMTLNLFGVVEDFFQTPVTSYPDFFNPADTILTGQAEANISIEQPYIFNSPIVGKLEFASAALKLQSALYYIYRSRLGFEFEMPRFTFINFLNTYLSVEGYNLKIHASDLQFSEFQNVGLIGVNMRSVHTNNLIFPSDGYNINLILEEGNSLLYLLSKSINTDIVKSLFYKVQFQVANYFGLSRTNSSVFATKLKLGHMQYYFGEEPELSIIPGFTAGGSNSVRGWKARELSVTDVFEEFTLDESPRGGDFLFEGSFEFRQRFLSMFGVALFTDYGNVWKMRKDFNFNDIAIATGFGFRLYTDFAPFRIDFGFKVRDPLDLRSFLKKPFFQQMTFHFGIGEAF